MRSRLLTLLAVGVAATVAALSGIASATPTCPGGTITTSKGDFSVYQYGGDVTGTLDANGCDIAVYYDAAHTGNVSDATITDATHYGVFVDGAAGNVTDSTVSAIHDTPFSGAQHGLGIYYTNGATGSVDGNIVSEYQKNGIAVTGTGTNVSVTSNTVTGNGHVPYIAQNGIEFGFGAAGSARGNTINGNWYTGANWTSTGLLLFDINASDVKTSNNMYRGNQTNHALIEDNACAKMYGGVYYDYGLCS